MKKKSGMLLGMLCLLLCFGIVFSACREPGEETTESATQGAKITYTVEIFSKSGMALEEIGVYIYTDASLKELVWFDKTNDQGTMTFTDVQSDTYVAVLDKVPEGYPVEASYPITGEVTRIELGAEMVEVDDLANVTFKLGDLMADFTVTTPEGKSYTISKLLQEKNAVVLNFWYLECNPCRAEFPYLQQAYEKYADKVEVLALNPVNTDDLSIAAFQKELGLTFPMAQCEAQWQQAMQLTAYPTTVVIDRFGNIAMIHKGSITEADTFKDILAFFSADDYQQTIVEKLEDIPDTADDDEEQTTGTKENPLEFGGVSSFQITVKPQQQVYCNVYKVDGMYMSISNANAYVIYNDHTYSASGGSLGLVVNTPDMRTPVSLVFGNNGTLEQTYTVYFSALKGTLNNPYTMKLGEFSVSVSAGNDQGIYYTYEAAEDGALVVQCLSATSGVAYDYTLYNLDTYAVRSYQSDASRNEDGKKVVSIKVSKGDTVQFSAAALPDSSGAYPAADFKFLASMGESTEEVKPGEEPILYAVTITDENRKPIAGAQVFMTVEEQQTALTTNADGVAHTKLKPGTYPITVKVPQGYKARTTEFVLTKDYPTVAIKLDPDVYVEGTYVVKLVNEASQPLENVLVAVGGRYGYTDYSGSVSFALEKAEYTADILVPEGYTADASSVPFGSEMSLTVTLKASTEQKPADPDAVPYSVTVVDNGGKPISNVLARFVGNDGVAAMVLSDAQGVAQAKLKPGSYTVSLAFSKAGSYYDTNTAAVSASSRSIHIRVTNTTVSKDNVVDTYMGAMYVLNEGSTYVSGMQANTPNYFVFAPERSGTYQFSTSSFSAVISYWGGNTSYIQDMTSSTDYSAAANLFTRNVKESNLGNTFVIAVTGTTSCIIDVVRIGDAVLDETDIVPEIYKGMTPTKQSAPSGKRTYVDITAATDQCKAVKGSDGYYHLNSATGPILYMDLSTNAPYVSMYNMLGFLGYGGTSLSRTFYGADGKATHREDYTECMMSYVECVDDTYGVYPLNDDLIYMIQNGGTFKGWWDSANGNYVFDGITGLNTEIAWMFACCYFA